MKKFIVSILAFLYITTSTGATMNMHYCMGMLADWDIGQNTSKKCSKCGSEKKDNGCCKDEHRFFKSQPDQKISETSFQLIKIISVALPPYFIEMAFKHISTVTENNPVSNAPPRTSSVAVYIRNCAFLI